LPDHDDAAFGEAVERALDVAALGFTGSCKRSGAGLGRVAGWIAAAAELEKDPEFSLFERWSQVSQGAQSYFR